VDVAVYFCLVADTGDGEPVQCSHGPWWLAAAATVPSWTLPRPIRKRCRQRSSHTILTWYNPRFFAYSKICKPL